MENKTLLDTTTKNKVLQLYISNYDVGMQLMQ